MAVLGEYLTAALLHHLILVVLHHHLMLTAPLPLITAKMHLITETMGIRMTRRLKTTTIRTMTLVKAPQARAPTAKENAIMDADVTDAAVAAAAVMVPAIMALVDTMVPLAEDLVTDFADIIMAHHHPLIVL